MKKLFVPLLIVVAAMFAVRAVRDRERAVRIDDGAGAEDLLLPRAVVGRDVHRRSRSAASRARSICSRTAGAPTAMRWPAAELAVLFGLMGLVTGPLWGRKAWGVWWQWDARLTIGAAARADVRRRTCWCGSTAARVGEAGGGRRRSSAWRPCRSSTSRSNIWRTIHPMTSVVPTLPRGDGARRSGSACSRSCCCFVAALDAARRTWRSVRRRSTSCISRKRTDDDERSRLLSRCSSCRARALQPPPPGRTSSCRSIGCRRADQLPAAPLLIAAYAFVWIAACFYLWSIWRRLSKVEDEMRRSSALGQSVAGRQIGAMTAGHFIFIPSVLLVGVVIGWILGSRAARDAFAAELRTAGGEEDRRGGKGRSGDKP